MNQEETEKVWKDCLENNGERVAAVNNRLLEVLASFTGENFVNELRQIMKANHCYDNTVLNLCRAKLGDWCNAPGGGTEIKGYYIFEWHQALGVQDEAVGNIYVPINDKLFLKFEYRF